MLVRLALAKMAKTMIAKARLTKAWLTKAWLTKTRFAKAGKPGAKKFWGKIFLRGHQAQILCQEKGVYGVFYTY